ncbi:hypothetical protein JCM10207_008128 [Rhodosporidiobolus poonsookiae]
MSGANHYRALSVTGLAQPSSTTSRRTSVDLKSESLPLNHDPHSDLLQDAYSRRSRLPRNYRSMRIIAYAGWTVAGVLFLVLILSHTDYVPEYSPFALGRMGGAAGVEAVQDVATEMRGKVEAASAGMTASASEVKKAEANKGAHKLPPSGLEAPVTIISSFYRVDNGKKHRVSEYHEWLTNFLHSVELPIIFYCAPSLAAYIKNLRGNKPITLITKYTTPFEMPPLQELGGHAWAVAQHKIDPEKHVHVPDVYGVWTAKPWIVKNAAELNPYGSEYFFWVDAGGFRDSSVTHDFRALPSVLDNLYSSLPAETVVLAATTIPFEAGTSWVKSARRDDIMDREDRLQGGWFGGKKEGVELWERETRKVTVLQSAMQRFAAKEQPVWTQAARLNWKSIYVQNMAFANGPGCGPDMWFRFEDFADGRDCNIPAWNGPEYATLDAAEEQDRRERLPLEGGLAGGGDEVGREGLGGEW